MKPPCDEAVVRSANAVVPCTAQTGRWVLVATILGSSMAFIDSTVVNVALPSLQSSLGATVVGVQWVVESYGLFLGALILAGGSLGDLFGRRLMFLFGVGIFATASVACGLASNIQQLVIARSVQGVGAAFLVPGSLSIISACFDETTRGQAIGTWSGFTAITTAAGPVLGGWLIQHASWRWAFFINIPLAAAVIAISLWRIPESRERGYRACRLEGNSSRDCRTGWSGLRVHRIRKSWLGESSGFRKPDRRLCLSDCFRARRGQGKFTHGSFGALSVAQFQRRESSHSVSLCRYWNLLLLVSIEPHPGAGILHNCDRRCRTAFNSADVPSFPLVRPPRYALRRESPADRRPTHCGSRLCSFRRAGCGSRLLESVLPCVRCSRSWNGDQRGSSHHGGNEFGRPGSCRHRLRHQQRGCAGCGAAGHRNSRDRDGKSLQFWLGSQLGGPSAAARHSSVHSVESDQTRRPRPALWLGG